MQVRQLAPFILLSLMLHVTFLLATRPLTKNFSAPLPHAMTAYFSDPVVPDQSIVADKTPIKKHSNSTNEPSIPTTQTAPLPDAATPAPISIFNPQQLMESSKNIARDEARKIEQHMADLEKIRLQTPVGFLEQYLKQPVEEIRLANGMLKIMINGHSICFQLAPYFARDSAGVFGIPVSCP